MFGLFKKRKEAGGGLKHWAFDIGTGFKSINNGDSIQYVNEDESIIIYFSVLIVSGKSLLTNNILPEEPTLIRDNNGWQLKGIKKTANSMLMCVISFKNDSDTKWVNNFFQSIKYTG